MDNETSSYLENPYFSSNLGIANENKKEAELIHFNLDHKGDNSMIFNGSLTYSE